MGKTIGIDLGTTNSCAAYHDGRQAHIIETVDGNRTMPSVVSLKDGRSLTGRAAKREIHGNADFTFRSFKRVIGREFNEQEHSSFQMAEGPNGEVWYQGPDRLYSAAELSSYLIKTMLQAAELKLGERPDGVVITHPAGFNERQKAATREAAQKAGIAHSKIHLMQEPAAAALAHGIDMQGFNTVAVYDLGGGTYDIALMRAGKGLNRVLALDGKSNLGGDDFDQRIVEWLLEKWLDDGHEDLMAKPHCMIRVGMAAEDAKIALTTQEQARIFIDNLTAGDDGLVGMDYTLTRAEFIEMCRDLIDETLIKTQGAIDKAKITADQVHHVILVGGMTRMPQIRADVAALFGREPRKGIVPEETVARGAATHAAMLDGLIGGSAFINCAAMTTGVRNHNGIMTVGIPKGADLPAEKMLIIGNRDAGQTACSIHVMQGEEERADDNALVVTVHAEHDPCEEGEASIEVLLKQDKDGALSVTVDGDVAYGVPNGDLSG